MTNPYSNEPIYVAVFSTLRDKIIAGEYLPGDLLPTEKELCAQFGATRATVRKGLNMLEQFNFTRSDPGKGSFVVFPRMNQFSISIRDDYPDCDIEVFEPRIIRPDDNVCRALRLSENDRALECRRVMRQNGIPVALDVNCAPYDPARTSAEQAAEFARFSRINAASGQPFSFTNRLILHAAGAENEVAALLECAPGSPLLVVTRFLFGAENTRRGFGKKYLLPPYGMIYSSCGYLPQLPTSFDEMNSIE